MGLATQVALVIAIVARVRQSWPRIEGRWVMLIALALAIVVVVVPYEQWSALPSVSQLAVRIASVFIGAVGSASFANYMVQKHANAIVSARSSVPPSSREVVR